MAKYGSQEQARHQRWRERQQEQQRNRKSKPNPPKNERRSQKPMSSPFEITGTLSFTEFNITAGDVEKRKKEKEEKAKAALARLMSLPGMEHIKGQIDQMIALKKVEERRIAAGLKCERQSLHMVFTGNPGTGKTTAARLIGEIFASVGLLKTTSSEIPFIEVHLNDVESKYLGESEENMKKKFIKARGGVLFMDEAYSFNGPYHHNKTFLANFVSLVEDMREEVLVIMAGYSDEMQEMLDSNPGIRSRFATIIDFPDYEIGPLLEIADIMAKDRDYEITGGYRTQLIKRLEQERKSRSFGNARTIRNILEQSIRLHAARIAEMQEPTKDQLMNLTIMDIDTEVKLPPEEKKESAKKGYGGMIVMEIGSNKKPIDKDKNPFL